MFIAEHTHAVFNLEVARLPDSYRDKLMGDPSVLYRDTLANIFERRECEELGLSEI